MNNFIHLSEYICKDYPSRINSPNENWWVKDTLSFSRLKSITNLCSKENLPIYILSQSTFTMPSLTLCNIQLFGICSLTGEKATAHCSNLPFSSYKWSWTLKRRAKVHVSVYIKPIYPLPFLFFFSSWRLITLQHCSGFCHTLTWISHGFTCVPHPGSPSHLPLHPIPLGLPSAPGPSTCYPLPFLNWVIDPFLLVSKQLSYVKNINNKYFTFSLLFFSFYFWYFLAMQIKAWNFETDHLSKLLLLLPYHNIFIFYYYYFGCATEGMWVLGSCPGIKSLPSALEGQSVNHWISREVPIS